MEINKNTIEALNSNLATRYALFKELSTDTQKIRKVENGIKLMFHINHSIKNYIKEDPLNDCATIKRNRIPLNEYWNELDKREEIINNEIIIALSEQNDNLKSNIDKEDNNGI
jgi:hypothetical protein